MSAMQQVGFFFFMTIGLALKADGIVARRAAQSMAHNPPNPFADIGHVKPYVEQFAHLARVDALVVDHRGADLHPGLHKHYAK